MTVTAVATSDLGAQVFFQPPAVGPRNEASEPAMNSELNPHDQSVGSNGFETNRPI